MAKLSAQFLAIIFGMNLLSCIVYKILSEKFARDVELKDIRKSKNGKIVYLIDGLRFKTLAPFKAILNDIPKEAGICLVKYKITGFKLKRAFQSVRDHMLKFNSENIVVFSASTGHLLANQPFEPRAHEISMNPFIDVPSLKKSYQLIFYFLPLIEIVVFLIGWVAYLPIIKIPHGQRYSIKLLVDHLAAIDEGEAVTFQPEVVLLDKQNRAVDNSAVVMKTIREGANGVKIISQSVASGEFESSLKTCARPFLN